MSRPFLVRGVLTFILSLLATGAFAHDREADTRLSRHLDDDVKHSLITRDDSILLKVAAVVAPDLLPQEYRAELPHCGTGLMLDLMTELRDADPQVRQLVAYALSAPSKRNGVAAPDVAAIPLAHREVANKIVERGKIAANAQTIFFLTEHFTVHYPPSTPDSYLATLAIALEESWTGFVTAYGFAPPVPANTSRIDVVVTNNVPCPLTDFPVCDSLIGAAVPPGFFVGTFDGPAIFIDASLSGTDLETTATHEFFHLLQYQNASPAAMGLNYWWCEGSASAAEDVIRPGANTYVALVNGNDGFLKKTNFPINALTYKSVLFHKFTMEKYVGGSATILRDILADLAGQTIPYVFTSLENVYAAHGASLDEAMKHFALWNFHTGARTTALNSYGDSSLYDSFNNFQGQHFLSPSVTSVPAQSLSIEPVSAQYVQFRPDSSLTNPRKLTIKTNVVGEDFVRGWLVIRRQNGNHEIRSLSIGPGSSSDEETINDFGYGTVGEAVLILTNGFPGGTAFFASYEAKLGTSLDIAFAMDTTGSMGGSITAIKNTALQAMQTLAVNGADFRIAITEFKDHPVSPYGSPGDFPYRGNSPFSNQPAVIVGGVNMLAASGGNDWPESQYSGVMGAINAVNITPWRSDAKKAIIVMTDAPPHDPEPFTGYTAASVIAAAQAGGISLPPNFPNSVPGDVSSESVVRLPRQIAVNAGNPIRIYGIVVGGDNYAFLKLSQIAEATGGKVYRATYSINDITRALLEAVDDVGGGDPEPPSNQAPNVASAIANPSQIWPPNGQMVPVAITNVTDPNGDAFTIRITAITQDEPVNAKNNGNRDADGTGVGTSTASVRAERDGDGNGRVYRISFTATDARGASSSGSVTVCVSHDQGGNSTCTDDGQAYDSTVP